MRNNGCKQLPSDVMHTLDNTYEDIDNKLFNRYVRNQKNIPREMKANYKQYAVELEREYRIFLRSYTKKINLLYREEKLWDMEMVRFGDKPKRHTFEDFQKAVIEYQKKNTKKNAVKTTA